MTDKISDLMAAAAARAVPVVRGVDDGRLGAVTPCTEFTVRDLLNHLFHVTIGFRSLAAKENFDFASTPDYLTGDWRDRYEREAAQLVEAWSTPESLEGFSPGMGFPQPLVAMMILLDLTVHPWDLARATGQPYEPDPAAVEALHALVEQLGPNGREMKIFGEAVEVPAGASSFDRLLGAIGRDPAWQRG